ncbi:MAG: ABC transporter substrate-binding protein [Alphaproteobacteria bacterium]|nr:ABC transporter substrate-binding protein [Alphaproteobacteria bacterium]
MFANFAVKISRILLGAAVFAVPFAQNAVWAETVSIPVLVPVTGFLSLEGTSQRNGALLALEEAAGDLPAGLDVSFEVFDTATSPEVAVNAFLRALEAPNVVAAVAPIFGTQMLALLPLAREERVPLVTISGTASITEQNNPYVFRFFPGDVVVKQVHARFAVEVLGTERPALITQTTAYGQSGRGHLRDRLSELGVTPVADEAIDVTVNDMLPVLTKVIEADADMLLLHLHSGPTALVLRQASAMGLDIPIVAGSALHQPTTADLLTDEELSGACAETGSSPISGGRPEIEAWTERYRARFEIEPDAFALGQYDGVRMVLAALADGARDASGVRKFLDGQTFNGLAMTYKTDGTGNMAHDAIIVCYQPGSRVPRIERRYENVTGVR